MPIEYVQVDGFDRTLDHEHSVAPNARPVNFDRYPCAARNCGARFELRETAAPGTHRRARNAETARRIQAERAAAAAAQRKRARRRRWRNRLIDVTLAAAALAALWIYAAHGGR